MLYYERGGEYVQVPDATRYERMSSSTPYGNCPTAYDVSFAYINEYSRPFGAGTFYFICQAYQRITGPLTGFSIDFPGPLGGGIGRSEGAQLNYSLAGITGYGSFITYDPNQNRKNQGDNQAIAIEGDLTITRVDGLPDDCEPADGGGCITRFYNGSTLVLELDSCPDITDGQGCSDCCRQLLPIVRGIRL